MTTYRLIEEEKQLIARCEKSIALEKLKKRRADTRLKIELGGLIIKSGMNHYNKAIILGALEHVSQLIRQDECYIKLFEISGESLFIK
ncbi:TPA: conjugal transfer protein TraD [Legionella anisa]